MTGSLQKKNGKYYAVLNVKNQDGKRRLKWINLNLDVKNNKRKAEQMLNELIAEYDKKRIFVTNKQRFTDFFEHWLESVKPSIKSTTYDGYLINFNAHIKPYFGTLNVSLSELSPIHIQSYYNSLIDSGLSAATVQKHHANIHKALDYAMKLNIIPYNPSDRVTVPKKKKYIGKFYNEEQLVALLELFKGTEIEMCVYLTANYGFRRSEVLGLKWDAVDFDKNTIVVRHTALAKKGASEALSKASETPVL